MTGLLAAEEIPRAAQFQVERRHPETRSEVRKFADCRQPSPRDRRQLLFRGILNRRRPDGWNVRRGRRN